jgi:hypothetical protein
LRAERLDLRGGQRVSEIGHADIDRLLS